MVSPRLPLLLAIACATAIPACDRDRPEAELARSDQERKLEEQPEAPLTLQAEDGREAPEEIYYDLTAYDWYRRGQPLVIDERAYVPAGRPEATRDREFEYAGEYMGVRYYVPEDTEPPHPVVYVPVFPGYWQPFATSAPTTRHAD